METVNHKFLNHYSHVISYYVDCILKSRMMLDEDIQLLITCWNPKLLSKKPTWNKFTLVSSTCATLGAALSLKFKSLLPVTVSFIPGIVQILQSLKFRYIGNKYKTNIENLLYFISQLYELNQNIMEYCQKRNSGFYDNKNNEAYTILLKPGEDFLRTTILTEVKVLETLKSSILQISTLVPVITSEYVHSLGWNFDEFVNLDNHSFKSLLHIFQKLNDLYVLVISNFLSCLGLSFCQQLWRSNSCDVKSVFNSVIPELTIAFKLHTADIKDKFNQIHFNLHYNKDEISRPQHSTKSSKEFVQLQKSFENFLVNLQVCFESGKYVQGLINQCNENVDLSTHLHLVEGVSDQLNMCEESMDIFLKSYSFLIKSDIQNKVNPLTPAVSSDLNVTKEIHFDDPEEPIEDEEYSLFIHGSDEGDIVPFTEYTDQLSTEYLELMLHELKIKIKNRKRKDPKNKYDVEIDSDNEQQSSVRHLSLNSSVPAPTPLPSQIELSNSHPSVPGIPQLPMSNESHLSVLDSVRTIAESLNRSEEFQFGFNMFPEIPRPFNTTYSCFSVAMLPGNERQDVERGGKIIMPPSALEQLTRLNINYPMLFKIINKKTNRISHCGVLEFVADEGKVYLPLWMMHNLVLEEGDLIQIESVSLPIGRFAKFQPLSIDFLDITNPKAVLENCLRTFACLTSGDVIAVKYNQRVYELCVLETQPGNAISIIECDMNVEFAAPVGYKESERPKIPEEDMVVDPADLMPEPTGFVAFRGTGNRLDGKRRKDSGSADTSSTKPTYVRGIPDYDYEIGTLRFLRNISKSQQDNKEENGEFKAFSGVGFSLKQRN